MFVFSLKTSKRQMAWAVVCVLLLIAILLTLALWPDATPTTAQADTDSAGAYLTALGYTAKVGEVRTVRLPDTPDETLLTYNALQKTAGMDLLPYCGKTLELHTYTVTDHPAGEAVAHLYLYKNHVVGGDISSPTADGFCEALLPRAAGVTHGTTG